MTEPDPRAPTVPDHTPGTQADINARGIRNVRRALEKARNLTETTSSDEAMEEMIAAEAWDEGFRDGKRQDGEGEDGPRFTNPYREGRA